MRELLAQIKNKSLIRIIAGIVLIILGLTLHLIPLFPAGWIIIAGLEILGIRLLVQDKIFDWLRDHSFFKAIKNMKIGKMWPLNLFLR